jgi:hypothetical protein
MILHRVFSKDGGFTDEFLPAGRNWLDAFQEALNELTQTSQPNARLLSESLTRARSQGESFIETPQATLYCGNKNGNMRIRFRDKALVSLLNGLLNP